MFHNHFFWKKMKNQQSLEFDNESTLFLSNYVLFFEKIIIIIEPILIRKPINSSRVRKNEYIKPELVQLPIVTFTNSVYFYIYIITYGGGRD